MKPITKMTIGLAAFALLALFPAGALGQHFSEWSPPVSLGPTINTTSFEVCPSVTKDGLSLYFGSPRSGGLGNVDIYVSKRSSTNDPWGPPQNLGPTINSPSIDNCPFVTPDGHTLIFLSNRPGGSGGHHEAGRVRAGAVPGTPAASTPRERAGRHCPMRRAFGLPLRGAVPSSSRILRQWTNADAGDYNTCRANSNSGWSDPSSVVKAPSPP
jgi:WD40-like Beta Propeller Repeat